VQIITLLVAGPIISRLNASFTLKDLENSLKVFKLASPNGRIVISTYEGEFHAAFNNLVDLVVINQDPGFDYFKPNPWPIEISARGRKPNYTRLITSTLRGLEACKDGFVIKTRVELLPKNPEVFSKWLLQVTNDYELNPAIKIGFFIEHYSGVCFSINGLLGGIPDTLQIGERSNLLRIWKTASFFWLNNASILTRKSKRFPVTSEQLLGLSFLQEFGGFNIQKKIRKLDRYYRSPKLIRAIIKSEREAFYWTSYKNSGFESDYLKRSFSLDISRFSIPENYWDLIRKLSLVQVKALYHHYRRYIAGLRRFVAS
jgi:hypothetical protein